jgi:ADP-ribose pyrophosphatase YjhB (NUDIX family)
MSKKTGPSIRAIPEGDNRERLICGECGFVHYDNPKIVVGAVATWQGRVLMCRRAIEPARGKWTIPAGYMELGETPEQGAAREAMEEACARLEIGALIGVYSIPRIGQVQLIYRATLTDGAFASGAESLETALYAWDEIPRGEIAFPTVHWALEDWRAAEGLDIVVPRAGRI